MTEPFDRSGVGPYARRRQGEEAPHGYSAKRELAFVREVDVSMSCQCRSRVPEAGCPLSTQSGRSDRVEPTIRIPLCCARETVRTENQVIYPSLGTAIGAFGTVRPHWA